jgi:KDO2-lipid IV(A) lauroyltransferase
VLSRLVDRLTFYGLRALRRGVRQLSHSRAIDLGATLGRLYVLGHGPHTRDARVNLAAAYPELGARERHALLVETYAHFGRLVAETILLDRLTPERLKETADIEGWHHLEAARAASPNGGAIVLTAHLGSFELFAAIMAHAGLPLSIVHRTSKSEHLDDLILAWRQGSGIEVIRHGNAARAVLRALQGGRVVAMPLDQNASEHEGVFVPFFALPACTRDAPALLAMRTGTPVVPAFMFRVEGGTRHRIRILPALELLPEPCDRAQTQAAVLENVRRMTAAIEAAVREAPAQWIWNHRRWKTQPEGSPVRLYKRRQDRRLRRLSVALGLRRKKSERR